MMIDYRDDARWTVYVHIVPKGISGYSYDKYYCGITSLKPEERWRKGYGYHKQIYFYNAISRYGWDNILHEIIAKNLTKDEACLMEQLLIKELSSSDKTHGYNLSSGGEYGRAGLKLSAETKQKIANSNKNKFVSDETKLKISKNHADVSYENNPNSKKVYQFDSNGIFVNVYNSVVSACEITKIDRHSISIAASHNRMAGNYLWAYEDNVVYKNNVYVMKNNTYVDKRYILYNKEVYQFTPDGNFVAKYISCTEASKETGIVRQTISSNAKNKNSSKTYIWRYKEDVIESEENSGSFLLK